ncbi:MAG: hypothetical protein H6806_01445 [Planctomycetes bacterium]|nr:hypothetical protein [Planctomycetota bacterium]MCB9902660.1 hypothetical protein [Planctomycetota bacterium]
MARDYSPYQQQIIRRWYANLDGRKVQRLAELVTDIYLASGAKKRATLWGRVRDLLLDDKTPADERAEVEAILAAEDVEALAHLASRRFGSDA